MAKAGLLFFSPCPDSDAQRQGKNAGWSLVIHQIYTSTEYRWDFNNKSGLGIFIWPRRRSAGTFRSGCNRLQGWCLLECWGAPFLSSLVQVLHSRCHPHHAEKVVQPAGERLGQKEVRCNYNHARNAVASKTKKVTKSMQKWEELFLIFFIGLRFSSWFYFADVCMFLLEFWNSVQLQKF